MQGGGQGGGGDDDARGGDWLLFFCVSLVNWIFLFKIYSRFEAVGSRLESLFDVGESDLRYLED